jgi:cell division protein FtsW
LTDLTQANYHTQQAVIAFRQGGLFGVGLGASSQKFGSLPVAHTDSIFAIIGEELGLVGATVVIVLYLAFVFRGFQIARRADQPFGMLLAAGITVWIFTQATINIAVMTALVPSTGVPLPFISFGGSSLVVVMIGVGLLLSVQRVTVIRQHAPEWRTHSASYDRGWRNRRARIPRPGRRRSDDRPAREGA